VGRDRQCGRDDLPLGKQSLTHLLRQNRLRPGLCLGDQGGRNKKTDDCKKADQPR